MSDWSNSVENANHEREAKIEDYRQLLDMFEQYPDIPLPSYWTNQDHNISVSKFEKNEVTEKYETEYDALEMVNLYARAQKALVAYDPYAYQRVPTEDNPDIDPRTRVTMNNGHVDYSVQVYKETVCEKVQVGEEVIPAQPEQVIPAKPERVESVYEYKCIDRIQKVVVPMKAH